MADPLGTGRCAIGCGSDKARYTLSSKGLAVCTCNACNSQVFARSGRSDELLRSNIKPASAAAAPAPAPADPPPVPVPAPAAKPPADPPPDPILKPARKFGWGLLAGREY